MQTVHDPREFMGITRTAVLAAAISCPAIGHSQLSDTAASSFLPNMVKVRSVYRGASADERGFGLIMFEKDDYLYIATPRHVVVGRKQDDEPSAESISVTFYRADQSVSAELEQQHDRYDLAMLRVRKPKDLAWNHAKLSKAPVRGERVWLLGHEWRWEAQPQAKPVEVVYVSAAEFEVNDTVRINSSGGIVVTNEGIVGMMIENNQDETKLYAHRLDFVADIVFRQWLQTKLEELAPRDDYPYLSIDGSAHLGLLLTSFGEANPAFGSSASLGVDYVWSRRLGLRFAHFSGRVGSKAEFALTNQTAEFRNDMTLNMIYLLYRFGDDLSRTPYVLEREGMTVGYIGLGTGKHDPRLNINGAGERPLDSYAQFQGSYDRRFHVLALGARWEWSFNHYLAAGFDIGLAFTDTKYLGIDVHDPFAKNDSIDFMMTFGVYVNVSFGKPPAPVVKALH